MGLTTRKGLSLKPRTALNSKGWLHQGKIIKLIISLGGKELPNKLMEE